MAKVRPKKTRRTPQKMAIEAFLEKNTGHPSAEEIHKALRRRFPTLSLSTVYSTLRGLQRDGRIHELAVEPGKARFDPEPEAHDHLICTGCRRIVDLRKEGPVALAPGEAHGFVVSHSHVSFYGLCPDCQARSRH